MGLRQRRDGRLACENPSFTYKENGAVRRHAEGDRPDRAHVVRVRARHRRQHDAEGHADHVAGAGRAVRVRRRPSRTPSTVEDDTPVDCTKVKVSYVLGHEDHGHPISASTGCTRHASRRAAAGHEGLTEPPARCSPPRTPTRPPEGAPPLTGTDEVVLEPEPAARRGGCTRAGRHRRPARRRFPAAPPRVARRQLLGGRAMLKGSTPRLRAAAVVVSVGRARGGRRCRRGAARAGRTGRRRTPGRPADKHGFATAHQLAGNAYLTLRAASLSEVYYPDLSTPAFRGLQFAVGDGKGRLDRETVDDDPRAHRAGRGRRARARRAARRARSASARSPRPGAGG